jgi:hypothetical protein
MASGRVIGVVGDVDDLSAEYVLRVTPTGRVTGKPRRSRPPGGAQNLIQLSGGNEMEHGKRLRDAGWDDSHSPDRVETGQVESLALGLPRSLVPVLMMLAYCTPEGQSARLRSLGPGSRLVLQSLGITASDQSSLTPLGTALVARLDDDRELDDVPVARNVVDLRQGLRPVARVVSTDVNLAAALVGSGAQEPAMVEYGVVPEGESPAEVTDRPVVGVARFGTRLRVWQEAEIDDTGVATLLDQVSMEPLPRKSESPLIVDNPDREAPATVLRRRLAVGAPRSAVELDMPVGVDDESREP